MADPQNDQQSDEAPEELPSDASPLELALYVFGVILIPLVPILMTMFLTPQRGF